MSVFADTSVLYAAADRDDRANGRAIEILSLGNRLVASDHVLVELWALVARRLGFRAAEEQWGAVRAGAIALEPVVAADLEVAFAIGQEFTDQNFSIVDRTSFAVMQRLGIHRAASFDEHFAIFRFGPGRRHAFEILA